MSSGGVSLFLLLIFAVPSAATAEVALYEGSLEVVKTSGALCGSNQKRVYPVEVVLDSNGSGIDGYFHGRDVSTGHFRGSDPGHLEVFYAFDDAELAEGHSLSLQPSAISLSGELREKHLPAAAENCNFDSAWLTLKRETARDGVAAWKESAALWQIELLNRRTFRFIEAGKYAEAVEAGERSLELSDRHFGPESSVSSVPLSNLAVIYRNIGRYAEAELLGKRVLLVAEKTLGPEHTTVAIRLMNLADLYESTGRYQQAEPLYRRALAIYEKALGPEHPEVAKVLNNLAVLYETLGRYREAEPLFERALAITKKALGPDHASAATLRHNLEELRKKHPSGSNVDGGHG